MLKANSENDVNETSNAKIMTVIIFVDQKTTLTMNKVVKNIIRSKDS